MIRIKISYKTGDSFNSCDAEGFVELEWHDILRAKESLKRIKNHYEFHIENDSIYEQPDCELPVGVVWDNTYRCIMLELITDDGEPYLYYPFWTGYFETLDSAEIVSEYNDMKYIPSTYCNY